MQDYSTVPGTVWSPVGIRMYPRSRSDVALQRHIRPPERRCGASRLTCGAIRASYQLHSNELIKLASPTKLTHGAIDFTDTALKGLM